MLEVPLTQILSILSCKHTSYLFLVAQAVHVSDNTSISTLLASLIAQGQVGIFSLIGQIMPLLAYLGLQFLSHC